MATIADLAVRGRADLGEIYRIPQEVQRVMQRASQVTQQAGRRMEATTMTPRDFRALESRTRTIEAGFQRLNRTASLVGRTLGSLGVGVGVGVIVREVASATAEMDSLERNLVAVLGNAAEARKEFEVLREISTAPGIDLAAAVKGATQLDAVERNLPLVNRQLKEFANAVALAGGSGPDLERVVLQLTQSAAAGKLLMADWRPIIQTAPLVGRAMIEAFGTLDLEEIQARGITMQEFFDRLLDAMEKMPRATDGAANAWDNLRSAVSQVSAAYGKDLAPSVQRGMNAISASLVDLSKDSRDMRALADGTLALGEALLVGGAVVGLVRLARALRDVEAATVALQAIRGPQGWLVLGVGALAYALYRQGDAARDAAAALDEYQTKLQGLNGEALASEHERQSGIYATVKRQIDALKPLIEQQEKISRDPTANLQVRAAADSGLVRNQKAYERLGKILADTAGNIRSLREAEAALGTTTTQTTTTTEDASEILQKEKAAVQLLASTYTELEARKIDASRVVLQGEDLAAGLFARAQAAPAGSELRAGLLALERQLADALHIPLQVELSASAVHDLQAQLDRNEFTVTPRIVVTDTGAPSRFNLGMVDAEAIQRAYEENPSRKARELRKEQADIQTILAEAKAAKEAALQHFRDTVQATQAVTSSFGDLADALGDVSPAVTGALRGVESFANGLVSFRAGRDQSGLIGTLGQVSGVVGIAAGALQLIGGFLNRDAALNEERNNILRQNQDALTGMREDFRNVMTGTNLSHAGDLASSLAEILRPGGSGINALGPVQVGDAVSGSFFTDPQLAQLASDAKLSFAQLNEIARQSGITLLDSTGHAIPQAFDQLVQVIDLTVKQITQFQNNLDDLQKRQSAYNEIFDVKNTPQQQLKDNYAILQQVDPALLKKLGLSNLNLDTEAGRNVLEQGLRDIFEMIDTGQLTADLLGAFTDKNQLLDAVLGADRALDGLTDTANQVSDALTNVPQGFRIANLELIRFNAQAAATAASLAGSTTSAAAAPMGDSGTPWVPRTRPLEPAGPQVEYADHRTYSINVVQKPGESGDDFARRVVALVTESAVQDNLAAGKQPTDAWSPNPRKRS